MSDDEQPPPVPRGRPSSPPIPTNAGVFPLANPPSGVSKRQVSPHRANVEVAAAVERNDLATVCAILRGMGSAEARAACLAPFGPMRVTALQLAAEHGDAALPIVQELLRNGARADVSDKLGRTPLHHAVAKGAETTTRALLAAGGNPNARFRVLPATQASASDDPSPSANDANFGVIAGEKLPLPECWGRTPLHLAVKENFPEIVSLLLNAGAHLDVRDERGLSPLLLAGLDIAVEDIYATPGGDITPQPPVRSGVPRYERIVSLLLELGASPFERNPETGATPLHHAVRARSTMAVEMLLARGADPSDGGGDRGRGVTPLHEAAAAGSLPIIKALLDKSGDSLINVPDLNGRTPLHMAASAGSRAAVTLLLARGGDLAARTANGVSAADALRDGIPRPAFFLCKLFDSCVTANAVSVNDRDFKIYAAMNVLCPHGESEQMGVVRALIEATPPGLQAVLFQHPLLQAFVRLKWQGLRTFYLLLVAVHLGFVGSLSSYAIDLVKDAKNWHIVPPTEEPLWYVLITTTSVVLLYILLQLWLMPWHYLREIETWLQMISALLAIAGAFVPFLPIGKQSRYPFASIYNLGGDTVAQAQSDFNCSLVHSILSNKTTEKTSVVMRNGSICMFLCNITGPDGVLSHCGQPHEAELHLLALALLLGWAQFMLLAGRFPTIGYYSLMFITVLTNVLKVLLSFCFLVIGFALSFVVLFNGIDGFSDPWESLGRTTVMMTGEFDYTNLFAASEKEKTEKRVEYTSRIVFALFIILAPIVLMNLMVGLAVSDIQSLVEEGQVRMTVKQADFVAHLEALSTGMSKPRFSRWLFCYCCWACSKPRGHPGCNVLRHAVPLTLTLQPLFPARGYPSLPDDLLESLAQLALRNRDTDRRRRRKAMATGGAQAAQMLNSPAMRPLGMALSMPVEGKRNIHSSCGYSSSGSTSSEYAGSALSGRTGGGGGGSSAVRVHLLADDTSAGEMSSPPPTSHAARRPSDRPYTSADRRPSELSVTQLTVPTPSARAHADIMRLLKRLRREVGQVRSHLLSEEDGESSNLLSASTRRGRTKRTIADADANVLAAAASFRRRRTSQAQPLFATQLQPLHQPLSPTRLPPATRNTRLSEVVTSLRDSFPVSRFHQLFNARPSSTDRIELVSPPPTSNKQPEPHP